MTAVRPVARVFVVLMTIALSACVAATSAPRASMPATTAAASSTASEIAQVTSTPVPSASPSAGALAEVRVLESRVNGVRLRSGPSIGAEPFVFPCGPSGCSEPVVINEGWTMVAFDGPVVADGYEWFLVQLMPEHPGSAHLGWVANPAPGNAWLMPANFECPAEQPDLNAAIEIGHTPLLYCYGGEEMSFEGHVVSGFGCNVQGTFEPAWLAHPCANMSYISPERSTDGDGHLFLHYPAPGVTNPTLELGAGEEVRIDGHFDDPASAMCVIEGTDEVDYPAASGFAATDSASDVAQCRMRFVVTKVTPLEE